MLTDATHDRDMDEDVAPMSDVEDHEEEPQVEKSKGFNVGEIIEGKREKKKVERLVQSVQLVKPKERLKVESGDGDKLGEIARINHNIGKTKAPLLKPLHKVLFDRPGAASIMKKNLRLFNGFSFQEESDPYFKKIKMMAKYTNAMLKNICQVLDIERTGKQSVLIERIMVFLMHPVNTGKPVSIKKKKKKKRKNTAKDACIVYTTPAKSKVESKSKAIVTDSSSDDDDDDDDDDKPESKETKTSSALTSRKKDDTDESSEEEVEDDDEEETPKSKSPAKKKPAAPKKTASSKKTTKSTPVKKKQAAKKKAKEDDSDASDMSKSDDSDNQSNSDFEKSKKKPAKPAPKTKKADSSSNKTAKKRQVLLDSDDSSDDDKPLIKMIKRQPTDDQITTTVKELLKDANLEEVTMKQLCQKVYDSYPEFDLTSRKDYIKQTVKSLIS